MDFNGGNITFLGSVSGEKQGSGCISHCSAMALVFMAFRRLSHYIAPGISLNACEA
jgi:hypothetical protein